MKIELTNDEALEIFHTAMCNSLECMRNYGLYWDWNEDQYKTAKNELLEKHPKTAICFEDVIKRMLQLGYSISLIDEEGDGYYSRSITLQDIIDRLPHTPIGHLNDMIEGVDDAITGDVIIQQCFYNDVIFG